MVSQHEKDSWADRIERIVKHFMFMIQIYPSQDFESWMFRMFRMFALLQSGKFRGHVAISHFNLDQGPLQRQSSQMSDFQEAGDAGAQEFQCVLECLRIFGKCCRAGLWEPKFMLALAQHQDPLAQFEALERWSSRHFSAMVTQWEGFLSCVNGLQNEPHFLEKVRDGLHLHVPCFRFFCQQASDAFNSLHWLAPWLRNDAGARRWAEEATGLVQAYHDADC